MKTYVAKPGEIDKKWVLIDAEDLSSVGLPRRLPCV